MLFTQAASLLADTTSAWLHACSATMLHLAEASVRQAVLVWSDALSPEPTLLPWETVPGAEPVWAGVGLAGPAAAGPSMNAASAGLPHTTEMMIALWAPLLGWMTACSEAYTLAWRDFGVRRAPVTRATPERRGQRADPFSTYRSMGGHATAPRA